MGQTFCRRRGGAGVHWASRARGPRWTLRPVYPVYPVYPGHKRAGADQHRPPLLRGLATHAPATGSPSGASGWVDGYGSSPPATESPLWPPGALWYRVAIDIGRSPLWHTKSRC